ncbi:MULTISPECIES: pyridoxal phosphate-dependent aminotransferase [Rothia]|jgi:aspartate aminotransferase|uniref:alanine transaminase n=1 Tax=Rothia aeria TaxID=172042 RepID=A0A2Z5R244_9MICC|nr:MULTISPECIES: pyridoxal phosphate-dependent aminotransferase [Rothia]MBF1648195.1 pyridoxal phosphate-dependent aminotransferase [Rothia dentocariosa]OXT12716.1 aminotransferase [Rothia sp. Olga]MBF1654345.1 pyridoxal phosphate-dependent aminotransferase [Rothia dentocariosa]MDK7676318.1 pyridoxal phosphate-dependent aminotransferase [Rothia aeria]MDO4884342.1 pyridoxal phosphate-dependent aminotransferase [Rothia sp. (in: high G+C Gram-positive bacteria)]
MTKYRQSSKLNNVLYDIRGPILEEANRMEAMGHRILKLNIGNTAPFGFEAPDAIMMDIIRHLPVTQGYSDSRGLYSARTAIVQHYQNRGILDLEPNDVYLGNGVSELIPMTLQALCETDDEILVPMPDYPLWTASVALSGGKPVHYLCDEENNWYPDLEDIKSKITSRTKGIVVINPNNPTGSVYPRHILQQIVDVAREHELVVFTDEIYEKIIYDGAEAINLATLTGDDVLCLTFSGLSKAYRVCGYRAGWVAITGPKHEAANYIEGITLLASMRLCSNVPAQHAIQTALGGYQSIDALVAPGGRLHEQRDVAYRMLNEIDGISCNQSDGALYLFPKVDTEKFNIVDDEKFMLDLLKEQKILFSHGGAFNWHKPDHFRLVFLPDVQTLTDALNRLGEFLSDYKQRA